MAEEAEFIQPFDAALVREADGRRIISAGASSYGYDMRLADDGFRVFSPIHGREIDPKRFDEECLVEPPLRTADDGSRYYLMPPHSYALGVTVELSRSPPLTGIAWARAYARSALVTPRRSKRVDGDLVVDRLAAYPCALRQRRQSPVVFFDTTKTATNLPGPGAIQAKPASLIRVVIVSVRVTGSIPGRSGPDASNKERLTCGSSQLWTGTCGQLLLQGVHAGIRRIVRGSL